MAGPRFVSIPALGHDFDDELTGEAVNPFSPLSRKSYKKLDMYLQVNVKTKFPHCPLSLPEQKHIVNTNQIPTTSSIKLGAYIS